MARYTATHTVRLWKAHRCVGCGAAYRYRFTRQARGQGRRPEAAQAALRTTLDRLVATGVDARPCPHCGVFQPDMLAQGRAKRFGWLLALIVLTALVLLGVVAADGLPIETAAGVLTLVGGSAAALLAWFARRDPNRDLAANRRAAGALVGRDVIRLDQPGTVDLPRQGPAWRRLSAPAAGALALGALLLPAPEAVRAVRGWPANAGFYPAVVGPGDRTTFYLSDHVDSLKGYWRGEPRVTVTNAAALGLAPTPTAAPAPPSAVTWPATSRHDSWGGTMSVKSSEKHSSHALWTEISVPGEPRLAGKTAQLDVRLAATYPQMEGSSAYHTVRGAYARQTTLVLAAEPRAGTTYRNLWLTGAIGGGTLLALTAWAMRRATWKEVPSTQLGTLPQDDAPGSLPPLVP